MQLLEMVNEIGSVVDGRIGPVMIKTYINRIIREVSAKILLDYNIASTTFSPTSGTEAYNLPADFSRDVAVKGTNVLDYEPWSLYAQKDRSTVALLTRTYTIMGTQILFNPPPNVSTATVTMVYGKQPADITTDTAEPGIPRNFHYVIKDGALLKALQAIPPSEDEGGRYQNMIPMVQAQFEKGVRDLMDSEANKGRMRLTPKG